MERQSKKVLIIDDDSRNIFALKAVLKAKNYIAVTASSAIDGLALLKGEHQIGIVLMDMMMPEMDGYAAIKQIRSHERLKDLPVIAVTAQAMVGDRERCLNAGANDYISKPINVDELVKILTTYL